MYVPVRFGYSFDKLYEDFAQGPTGRSCLQFEGISPDKLDLAQNSKNYFNNRLADSSIDMNANANEELSANNYSAEITKPIMKLEGYYLLHHYLAKRFDEGYANRLVSRIWDGHYYFHDASGTGIQIPYCFAFSTGNIVEKGRPYGQLHSLPPKRADSFIAQVTEVCMDLSQEFAGAIAPSDIFIYYSYFAKKENLSDERIINDFQKFIHVMNNKFRTSGQSPFTNVSLLDRKNLETICENIYYPDYTQPDIDYILHVEKVFGEFFAKGDPATGMPYRFPVVTINIAVDDDNNVLDEDFLDWAAKVNTNLGNFNIYGSEGNKIASCCRLTNDFDRLAGNIDSFGNGGTNIGSHRVVTINLPRLALECKNEVSTLRRCEEFYKKLDVALDEVRDLLLTHREEILKRRIEQGFAKFFKPLGWADLHMFFSTIGIVGTYEVPKFLGMDPDSGAADDFVARMLQYIDDYAKELTPKTGWSFNIEQIPAESAAVSLRNKDNLYYDLESLPFYSNQFVPLVADVDIIDRIERTGKFMDAMSGGGILHLNIQDKIKNSEQMKKLIRMALKKNVQHFAVNYGFGECENGHTTICGNSDTCPECGAPIKYHLTRVIGYFTKVDSWNKTRIEKDFPNRVFK